VLLEHPCENQLRPCAAKVRCGHCIVVGPVLDDILCANADEDAAPEHPAIRCHSTFARADIAGRTTYDVSVENEGAMDHISTINTTGSIRGLMHHSLSHKHKSQKA